MDRLERGNFTHRPLKLEKHHQYIVDSIAKGVRKDLLAEELGVDRKTLYHYINAYIKS